MIGRHVTPELVPDGHDDTPAAGVSSTGSEVVGVVVVGGGSVTVPVPVSVTVSADDEPVAGTSMTAASSPATDGSKATAIVQVSPAATGAVHVFAVTE